MLSGMAIVMERLITKMITLLRFIIFFIVAAAISACPSKESADHADMKQQDELRLLRSLPYASLSKTEAEQDLKGVVRYDKKRAFRGYNLYSDEKNFVLLMDMEGKVVHRWQLPPIKGKWEFAECLDDGTILVLCVGKAFAKINKESMVIWLRRISVHHDIAILDDGSLLIPINLKPVKYHSRKVFFDGVMSLSPSGDMLGFWSTFSQLSELQQHHEPSALDKPPTEGEKKKERYEYYHLNTIEVLPETELGKRDSRFKRGNYLLCLRNASVIIILDQKTGDVVWSYGPGILDWPHMPTMLDNGHILIFDNGVHRTYSRVIEIDPVTGNIVWEYKAEPPEGFHSKWRGSNQRLPNGNTLICESEKGRAFEVTPEGEIVWEFYNPVIVSGKRFLIYRMMRLFPEDVEKWLDTEKEPKTRGSLKQ
jgi:hypothetical protein